MLGLAAIPVSCLTSIWVYIMINYILYNHWKLRIFTFQSDTSFQHFDKCMPRQQIKSHFAAADFERHLLLFQCLLYSKSTHVLGSYLLSLDRKAITKNKTIILGIAPLPVGEHLQHNYQHNSFVACPQNHKYEFCDTHIVVVETLTARKFHTR